LEVNMAQIVKAAPRRRIAAAGGESEVSFRLEGRNAGAAVPIALWTDIVVDGKRVFLRTRRPVPLLNELCASAVSQGLELPEIEVKPIAADA
jgi:hypothetical protein